MVRFTKKKLIFVPMIIALLGATFMIFSPKPELHQNQDSTEEQSQTNVSKDTSDKEKKQPVNDNRADKQAKQSATIIVSFESSGARQRFLDENNLTEEDLTRVGDRQAFSVRVDSPTITDGVQEYENKQYKTLLTPNDPLHSSQYYTDLINAESAWDISTGSSDVLIAIVDTGYVLNHQDMSNRWFISEGESGAGRETNGLDDDGNGKVDDWRGWDFSNNDNSPQAGTTNPGDSDASHGTYTSGLLGATGNNNLGVASLDWQADILPIQAISDSGSGFTDDIAAAVDYAVEQGADIINLSLGTTGEDPLLGAAIADAKDADVLVVAAAGNCGGSDFEFQGCDFQGQMLYPAIDENVVAVGASNSSDERADFSSWGPEIDIIAPGAGAIRTTSWSQANQTSLYSTSANGTSISSPIVAGLAGLIKSENPGYDADQLQAALEANSTNVSQMGCLNLSEEYGYGRIDAFNSLENGSQDQELDYCKSPLGSADFNGNGNDDIFWYGPGAGEDLLWSGSSNKSSFANTNVSVSGSYVPLTGDFNGDGQADIFWYGPGGSYDRLWYGTTTKGGFDSHAKNIQGHYAPITGDFNGDGRDDVFWYGPGKNQDRIWYGNSTKGSFSSVTRNVSGGYTPLSGDFNGDGRDDIFWYGPGGDYDRLWFGNSSLGSFDSVAASVNGTYSPVAGDINGDGRDDVFWYGPSDGYDRLWYGLASKGRFDSVATNVNGTYDPIIGDFNGDNRADIFWYGRGDQYDSSWFGNPAKGSFSAFSQNQPGDYQPVY